MVFLEIGRVSRVKKVLPHSVIRTELCKIFRSGSEYYSEDDEYRSMLGKFILQRMLLNSGITCDSINGLEKNKNGKWFLRRSDIDFNIAHAGDLVVCALTDTGLVGVDVELHRGLDYASFGKSFTVEELSLIKESPDSRRAFFDLWTKKESLLKAWGEGLSIEPHDAVVDQNSGYIRGTTKRGYFRVIPLEGYSCCICTSVPISDSDVQFSAASHY